MSAQLGKSPVVPFLANIENAYIENESRAVRPHNFDGKRFGLLRVDDQGEYKDENQQNNHILAQHYLSDWLRGPKNIP